ncbi:uncharacterized protein DUF2795 [Haloactinospora alba]|uniref:Uncharacterized protein DUF2795 n=1 Tax=Haloactinospora alba TaxID=405555 RepID=A0A543NN26_9ACTN|nr:DUF2795 domain-containing protein [Haloactinospora alba]TQN33225.1 uncharacterized protein DUF2795 [Haloactinospora alba]
MTATTTTRRLKAALDDVDYPADKDQLVRTARDNGADEDTVRALEAMPPTDYGDFDEVTASVQMTDDAGPLSDAEKARARRHHTTPGVAETEKETPDNPIEEELGENRGS